MQCTEKIQTLLKNDNIEMVNQGLFLLESIIPISPLEAMSYVQAVLNIPISTENMAKNFSLEWCVQQLRKFKHKDTIGLWLFDWLPTQDERKEWVSTIQFLDMSNHNLLNAPKSLECFENLLILDLSHNHLEVIPDLGSLKKLTVLTLNHNPIREIPTWIEKLESLESIELNSTNITSLPKELITLPVLCSISIILCPNVNYSINIDGGPLIIQ